MLIFLAIFTFALFSNTLGNGFITGDDYSGFLNNEVIRDIGRAFGTFQLNHFYFALVYKFGGENPFYLHLFSVIFHVMVVLLVYKCFSLAFNKKIGFMASLLFSVHPLVTETVDWISATPYLFNAMVAFGTLFLYLKYKKTSTKIYLFLAQAVFALATVFFRSPWILTTPMIITVFELFVLRTSFDLKAVKTLLVFYLISIMFFAFSVAGLIVVRQHVLKTEYFMDTFVNEPVHIRLFYPTYKTIKLLLIPTGLTLYHEGDLIPTPFFIWMISLSVIYVVSIAFLFWKNRPLGALTALIFLILVPVYIPQIKTWMVAERYLYIPTAFFCLLLSNFLIFIERKTAVKHLSYILMVTILIFYSYATFIRNTDWKTNKTFWLKTAEASPNSYRAYNNAGDAFATDNDLAGALKHFQKAVSINGQYADGWHNIGFTYMQTGDLEKAKLALAKAFQLNPLLYQASYKLGYIELKQGNKGTARKYLEETLKLKPDYKPAIELMVTMSIAE